MQIELDLRLLWCLSMPKNVYRYGILVRLPEPIYKLTKDYRITNTAIRHSIHLAKKRDIYERGDDIGDEIGHSEPAPSFSHAHSHYVLQHLLHTKIWRAISYPVRTRLTSMRLLFQFIHKASRSS